MKVKYPHVKVELVGKNGNAYSILGLVQDAMEEAGLSKKEIEAYMEEAMAGDYDNLLYVTMKTVDVY